MRFLSYLQPAKPNDKWLFICLLVILEPIVYCLFQNYLSYFSINIVLGVGIAGVLLYDFILARIRRNKFVVEKNTTFWFGFAFIFWMFIGSFFTVNASPTWIGVSNGKYVKESIFQFIFYFLFFCAARKTQKCNRYWLTSVMVWLMCFYIALGFVGKAGVDIPGYIASNKYAMAFYHINHAGYLAVVTGTLAFSKFVMNDSWRSRVPFGVAFALHAVYFCVNGSLGPILAIIATIVMVFVVYLARKKWRFVRRMAIVLAVFVCAFCVFDFVPKIKDIRSEQVPLYTQIAGVVCDTIGVEYTYRGKTIEGSDGWARKEMWEDSIETTLERPLFGTGASTFEDVHPEYGLHNPHNEFLQYSSSNGIPCLMFYLAFVLSVVVTNFKKRKEVCEVQKYSTFAMIGYLISSFFGCTIVCVMPQYFMVIGFATEK